jgi:multiple sugar transport system permease protein
VSPSASRARSSRTAYRLMFLPALLMLIAVMVPFVQGIYTAMTDRKLYLETESFVGLGNFITLFGQDGFVDALVRTLAYALAVIVVQVVLGLAVAMLLNADSRLQPILRGTLVLPLLIPPVVAGLMWKTLMQPQSGLLNWILTSLGLPESTWLSHVDTALVSVLLIDTWVFTPFAALILLAGLQSIPVDQIEAAQVDGASGWLTFRAVQLPWLLPFIILVVLFRVSDSLKSFELFYATTRGGPLDATTTLHVLAYEEAFRWSNVGRAMAIVFVLWLISYVVSMVLTTLWRRKARV